MAPPPPPEVFNLFGCMRPRGHRARVPALRGAGPAPNPDAGRHVDRVPSCASADLPIRWRTLVARGSRPIASWTNNCAALTASGSMQHAFEEIDGGPNAGQGSLRRAGRGAGGRMAGAPGHREDFFSPIARGRWRPCCPARPGHEKAARNRAAEAKQTSQRRDYTPVMFLSATSATSAAGWRPSRRRPGRRARVCGTW